MRTFSGVAAFCLALQTGMANAQGLKPDIRADTNRDGVVDVQGSSDLAGKTTWTAERGAVFLPNIGDKTRRCASTDNNKNPLSNDEMAACSDASGHLLFAPEYVAPLRTLPINLSADATANIYATPRAAYERVRLFVLDDETKPNTTESWRLVDQEFIFNSSQLAKGITLGIDGREPVKDAGVWNGSVSVMFKVTDHNQTATDGVALQIAPVLTHNHLQSVETVVSTSGNNSDPIQANFVRQIDEARIKAGVTKPLLLFNQSDDIWAQDFLEPAYASMPGPNGPIAIRVMMRSAQSTRTGGRQIFEQLRGPGVGGFQPPIGTGDGFGHREINSFGNLETIPPYTSKSGVKYPAGRIIMGKHFDRLPAKNMLEFLQGQRLQTPLILETGWLVIGHVDEFVQFLPYDNKLGFTIAISDTKSAIDLLKKASTAGHGGLPTVTFTGAGAEAGSNTTIDQTLADTNFTNVNEYVQKHIDANLRTLLEEIPLDPKDVIYVPSLFRSSDFGGGGGGGGGAGDGLPSHGEDPRPGEYQVGSLHPGSINGIVIGKTYVCPKPFGPVIDGVDILAQAVEAAYARAGVNVTYVDDYLSHHVGGGEVHCGSNTLRQTDLAWWN